MNSQTSQLRAAQSSSDPLPNQHRYLTEMAIFAGALVFILIEAALASGLVGSRELAIAAGLIVLMPGLLVILLRARVGGFSLGSALILIITSGAIALFAHSLAFFPAPINQVSILWGITLSGVWIWTRLVEAECGPASDLGIMVFVSDCSDSIGELLGLGMIAWMRLVPGGRVPASLLAWEKRYWDQNQHRLTFPGDWQSIATTEQTEEAEQDPDTSSSERAMAFRHANDQSARRRPNTTSATELKVDRRLAPFLTVLTGSATGQSGSSGQEQALREVIVALSSVERPCVAVIAEPGTGKSTLLRELARVLAGDEIPARLRGRELFALDAAAMASQPDAIALARALVEWAEKTRPILTVDELHVLSTTSGSTVSGLAQALKPALADGRLSVVGATTLAEWHHITDDEALQRRFATVLLAEPTPEATVVILRDRVAHFEEQHQVSIDAAAITAAVELADRYLPSLHRPAKAINALDGACALVAVAVASGATSEAVVRPEDVAAVISSSAGVPVRVGSTLTEADRERARTISSELNAEVIGQSGAVDAVVGGYQRQLAGLGDPDRPLAFLLAGPTGTGKTELIRAFARGLFGAGARPVIIDCGELTEEHRVSRLIGSPTGYVGSDTGGELTEALRAHPHTVVLFDELEKAHPKIHDLILGLLDSGRLTDGRGRTVDARSAIICATTNAGSSGSATTPATIQAGLARVFRPEFIARWLPVPFEPLNSVSVGAILDKRLDIEAERLVRARGAHLTVASSLRDLILARGFDSELGVRPLRAEIERTLTAALSEAVLDNRILTGSEVRCSADDDGRVVVEVS